MSELEARFWAKVEPDQNSGCWLWAAGVSAAGYGRIKVDGKAQYAHRVALHLAGRSPADAEAVCHRCDTPACVNPNHLWVGTQADNLKDMWAKGRARPAAHSGAANGRAKLTNEAAAEMRKAHVEGVTARVLAERYGICRPQVNRVLRNPQMWSEA